MVTISTADKALKTFYLGVLADQLNVGVNPLLAKIGQTSADVWGKEVKKLAPYGINGGVGSGEENDNLPQSGGNNYAQFTLTLKNLFGQNRAFRQGYPRISKQCRRIRKLAQCRNGRFAQSKQI